VGTATGAFLVFFRMTRFRLSIRHYCRVDDFAHCWWGGEDGMNFLANARRSWRRLTVLLARHSASKSAKGFLRLGVIRALDKSGPLKVILRRSSDLSIRRSFREMAARGGQCRFDCVSGIAALMHLESLEAVHDGDQILRRPGWRKLVHPGEPEFCPFIIGHHSPRTSRSPSGSERPGLRKRLFVLDLTAFPHRGF